jgi:hypothetical protein
MATPTIKALDERWIIMSNQAENAKRDVTEAKSVPNRKPRVRVRAGADRCRTCDYWK